MAETKKTETKKTETVYIPYVRNEETHLFVGVNGRTYQIERGEYVEVPACVAEIIRHSETEIRNADEFVRRNVSDFSEKLKNL